MRQTTLLLRSATLLLLFCSTCTLSLAQDTPGTVKFPAALDTQDSLFRTSDNARSTLASSITSGSTTLTLAGGGTFPSSSAIVVDSEVIYYTGRSTNTLTGLLRGQEGTTAASHSVGVYVKAPILSSQRDVLVDVMLRMQAKLGFGTSTPTAGAVLVSNGDGSSYWTTTPNLAGATGIGSGTGGVINPGSTTVGAASLGATTGKVSLQTKAVERVAIENDGGLNASAASWVDLGGGTTNVKRHGAKCDNATNDSAAFLAALDFVVAAKGGTIEVPSGRCLISSTVVKNLATYGVKFRGVAGNRSQIRIATGALANGFTFTNGGVAWEEIVFVGTLPDTNQDAQHVFQYTTVGVSYVGCKFIGLVGSFAGGAIIVISNGSLTLKDFYFGGSAAVSGANGSVIVLDNYSNVDIRDGSFIDYFTLDGVFYTKTLSTPLAWIQLARPANTNTAQTAPQVVIDNVTFDEGALYNVFAFSDPFSGGGTLRSLLVNNCRGHINVADSLPATGGIYVNNAEHVSIRGSWFKTYANLGVHYGTTLDNVTNATIDSTRYLDNGDRIKASSSVASLTLINVTYNEANSRADLTPLCLTVTKAGRTSGGCAQVTTLTAATTLDESHRTVQVDTSVSGADVAVTLPAAASCPGRSYTIVKTDAAAFSAALSVTGGGTINGSATKSLTGQWQLATVQSNGSQWIIVGQ